MTDLDVHQEYWRAYFWSMKQSGNEEGDVLEVDSSEAFEEGIKEWEREAELATQERQAQRATDFEKVNE